MNILVTGGCGFIGTNYINSLILENFNILNIDKLTYAGREDNLENLNQHPNYSFITADISDPNTIKECISDFRPSYIINFAAESHVDNSIKKSTDFIQTNIFGTFNLLEQIRKYYDSLNEESRSIFKFHHISTDEVFGDMESELFHEKSQYKPSSPYSASKASADHLVRAWGRTYDLPFIITICSNNFGPYQHPEKLIPTVIINAINEKKIPVYGDGMQIRDWIYVSDHVDALIQCIQNSVKGETYNIGSSNQISNLSLIKMICNKLDLYIPRSNKQSYFELIEFVKDRPGHDRKYGINSFKAIKELRWKPKLKFIDAIDRTVQWYINNKPWWQKKNHK